MLKAPFPYFGGKSRIAAEVWRRFGDTPNYVEPFFGSGAVLLSRPSWPDGENRIETVNDADGFVSNFWRALRSDPEAVAHHADWPVIENDLHARHSWLVGKRDSLQCLLDGNPDYYDAKIAGWWVWGMSCWIGSGFCSGEGPWHVVNGKLVNTSNAGTGVNRKRPHLGNAGKGVKRKLPHLGDAGHGVNRQLPHLGDAGKGVNRKRPHLGGTSIAQGVNSLTNTDMLGYLTQLSERIKRVRVCCGDWSRVCGPCVTFTLGMTAVFLDPPYSAEAGRDNAIYRVESATVAHDVRRWAIEKGENPLMRIALCGYGSEHNMPDSWEALSWKAKGGYGSQGDGQGRENASREMVWFSPACVNNCADNGDLFACGKTIEDET